MAEPEADRRDVDEAQEALGGFVIAGRDTMGILELVEVPLSIPDTSLKHAQRAM